MASTRSGDSSLFSHSPVMTFIRERLAAPLLNQPAVREMLMFRLAQLGINYRTSSLSEEADSGLRRPGEWLKFRSAPRAGDRAPQAHAAGSSVFQELRSGAWTLLLFAGDSDVTPLREIAQRAEAFAPGELRARMVLESADHRSDGSLLIDSTHAIHRTYAAHAPTLVLIRPDGYIGFRGAPPAWAPLEAYLQRVFFASPVAVAVGSRSRT
jgi:hypothetical protein